MEAPLSTDEALLQRYALGEVVAFDQLYARHEQPLWRCLLRSCRDRSSAEELAQEVWFAVARDPGRFGPEARFVPWLYTVARNRVIDRARVARQHVSLDEPAIGSAPLEPVADAGSRPDAEVLTLEQGQAILEALDRLPDEQREAFVLQADCGLSVEEIARVSGTGFETAKSRLRYARERLNPPAGIRMSAPEEEPDDTLAAYRAASASDAGRPSGATRAAILAEARAAAAARTARPRHAPAANDRAFSWRLAAGLVLGGVALLVWRQLPREDTRALESPSPRMATDLRAETEGSSDAAAPLPSAPPAAPALAQASAASNGTARRREERIDVAALVSREFPALAQSPDPPAGVWMVLDASGGTLRKGTLARGQSMDSVQATLQRELPAANLQPFDTRNLRIGTGAIVLVGIARAD